MSGHPLHPALAHFPVACWSLASALDLASRWLPAAEYAAFLLAAGTLIAVPVMAAGLLDARRVKEAPGAEGVLALHMSFVIVAWLAYALSLLARWDGASLTAPGGFALALSAGGFGALVLAGWFGAQLVYAHGVGVRRLSPGSS